MRIEHFLQTLIAVLNLAALCCIANPPEYSNLTISRSKRSPRQRHHLHGYWYDSYYKHHEALQHAGRFLNHRENQMLLREEAKNRTEVDCCPSVLEMVEPEGGQNQDDIYVELFRDGNNRQRFYELSCHEDILNKPCRFMDKKIHNNSKCIQKYSYTYAIVKDPGKIQQNVHQRPAFPTFHSGTGETRWTLDYIKVRSGCSCVVTPVFKRKRDKFKHKRQRHENNYD